MNRAYGSVCTISPYRWEGCGDPPGFGAQLLTARKDGRAGSFYVVLEARPIGGDPNRLHLTCLRSDPALICGSERVYALTWDSRKRRAAGSHQPHHPPRACNQQPPDPDRCRYCTAP